MAHLSAGSLVGVLSRLQLPGPQGGQLGLEHGHTAARGGHELVGRLQRWSQGTVGLPRVSEHAGEAVQQVLHQLENSRGHQAGVYFRQTNYI